MPWFEVDYTVKGKLIMSANSMGEAKHQIEHFDDLSELDQLNENFTVKVDKLGLANLDEHGNFIEEDDEDNG